jgi:antitoxin YqcF
MEKIMAVSADNKKIAQAVKDIFGGEPIVRKYWDERNENHIDILMDRDIPEKGVTSFSTLGLSDHNIGLSIKKVPLRIEIVGACGSQFDGFPNILSTCAFNIINSSFACRPGTIFPAVVKMYFPDIPMKHIFFKPPFLWGKKMKKMDFTPRKIVTWLQAIPISDEEFKFADDNGPEELDKLFTDKQIDVFNLRRPSAI